MAKVTQSQLNLTPSTQANAGTAGGTMSYINIGGIKQLWCLTGNLTSNANYTFTLPTSFFTTITSIQTNAANMTALSQQYTAVTSGNTTTITVIIVSAGGAATAGISLFVIGT